jgi:23S rRNA (adenine2503-C2)-methyltransferase
MNFEKIEKIILKEKKFRQDQIRQAIFRDLIKSWDGATTLPAQLRDDLKKNCPMEIKAEIFASKDGHSVKALIELEDGLKIETVLMRHLGRNTICVSSQVGCPLGCSFCATGKAGFKRNLTSGEIIEQVLFFARYLKKDGEKVNNIVFMGMGEPFLNYDNVFTAIRIINDAKGLAIGSRHISISTVGIIEGIEKMSQEPLQINLAISLHAPDDKLRCEIMPINNKYPIEKIFKAVDFYIQKTRRKVMFEYIMIKGVNDSCQQAKELAVLMKRPLVFVNLIAYNPTGVFEATGSKDIKKFKDVLMKAGIQAIERYRFGSDVKGACGQLAGEN